MKSRSSSAKSWQKNGKITVKFLKFTANLSKKRPSGSNREVFDNKAISRVLQGQSQAVIRYQQTVECTIRRLVVRDVITPQISAHSIKYCFWSFHHCLLTMRDTMFALNWVRFRKNTENQKITANSRQNQGEITAKLRQNYGKITAKLRQINENHNRQFDGIGSKTSKFKALWHRQCTKK